MAQDLRPIKEIELTEIAPGGLKMLRITQGMLLVMLLTGCAVNQGSETSRSICRELARDLPTYSISDTKETLESGARFMDVFKAVCNEASRN